VEHKITSGVLCSLLSFCMKRNYEIKICEILPYKISAVTVQKLYVDKIPCKLGFTVDQHGRNSELPDNFQRTAFSQNLTNLSGDTRQSIILALHEAGFIMGQYRWK
jgi:hypothetical protein